MTSSPLGRGQYFGDGDARRCGAVAAAALSCAAVTEIIPLSVISTYAGTSNSATQVSHIILARGPDAVGTRVLEPENRSSVHWRP